MAHSSPRPPGPLFHAPPAPIDSARRGRIAHGHRLIPRGLIPGSAARLLLLFPLGLPLGSFLGPFVRGASPSGGLQEQEAAPPLLRPPAPAIALRPERLGGLADYACAGCHAEVTAEWAGTSHALAWVDEAYRAALKDKKRPELCHGCHAPEPLLAGILGSKPETRAERRELGVDCESCHADEHGAMLGPRGTPVEAHASVLSPALSVPGSNALCASCHQTNIGPVIGIAKDFIAAGLETRGLSCVGCHMAPVERAWATDAPRRTGRSHALQTPRDPAFLRLAFGLELREVDGRSRVIVSNQAGHRVPGLIGRRIAFEAELLDGEGTSLETRTLELDERAYLPVDASREIRFTRAGASVRLKGLHRDPRAAEPVSFLEETLAAE